jgi:LPS O-antigen subunit length determinant protein (WzzB/FepE family)
LQNNENTKYIEEDEIDLKELFKTIWDRKVFIVSFTFIVTAISIVYVLLKNPVPIYQGNLMIEIGEGYNKNTNLEYFDDVNNLKDIIKKEFGVSVNIPKSTNKLLSIEVSNKNKEKIKSNINKALDFILKRHKEKAEFYDKYIMTKTIGDIEISNTPVNIPKKKLIVIVTFITSFIFSIFLVFFMNFIKSFKEENQNDTPQ